MKPNAIFISAGKNEDLATYVLKHEKDNFDIYINIYENCLNQEFIEGNATKCFNMRTTKFIALKRIYEEYLSKYDIVCILDDDGIFTHGSVGDLPEYIHKYNLDIISPAQHPYGKLSPYIDQIMRYYSGDHKYRIVNYVEMNFPVFKNTALKKYMDIYDGQLCGWGNDWWYLNVLDADNRNCCGITDKVVVYNPDFHQKKFRYKAPSISDIDVFMTKENRKNQWKKRKEKYNLIEWDIKNKEFVF